MRVRVIFEGWGTVLRTLLVGTLAYAGLLALLRISGKRTLAKMNAFDLVVTVALGSTLATILISKDVALAEGLAALALLLALQFAVTWLSMRSRRVQRLVKNDPALLVYRGRVLDDALHRERVAREEILQAIRAGGHGSLETVDAVVLETDGTFSVIAGMDPDRSGASALREIDEWERRQSGSS